LRVQKTLVRVVITLVRFEITLVRVVIADLFFAFLGGGVITSITTAPLPFSSVTNNPPIDLRLFQQFNSIFFQGYSWIYYTILEHFNWS
jgi:hypothetical protein